MSFIVGLKIILNKTNPVLETYFEVFGGFLIAVYLFCSKNEKRNELGTLILGFFLGLNFTNLIMDSLGKEKYIEFLGQSWKETSLFHWMVLFLIGVITYRLRKTFKSN